MSIDWNGRRITDFEDVVIAARREVWGAVQDGVFGEADGTGVDDWPAQEGLAACGVPGCAECPVLPEAMGWLSGSDGEQLVWAAMAAGRAAAEAGLDAETRQAVIASVLMEGAAIRMDKPW